MKDLIYFFLHIFHLDFYYHFLSSIFSESSLHYLLSLSLNSQFLLVLHPSLSSSSSSHIPSSFLNSSFLFLFFLRSLTSFLFFFQIGTLYRVEQCSFNNHPAPFFLTIICIIVAMNFGSLLWMQFLFVMRETTSHYVRYTVHFSFYFFVIYFNFWSNWSVSYFILFLFFHYSVVVCIDLITNSNYSLFENTDNVFNWFFLTHTYF